MAAANFTLDQVYNQLTSGRTFWSGATITYRFPTGTAGLNVSQGEATAFRAPTSAQQAQFVLAAMTWDDLIAPDFSATTSTSSNIEFAYTTTGISFAHGYYPAGGTVWFNASKADLVTPTAGTYGFQTLIHEIGHTMGLNHMGNYDGAGSWTPSSYQDSVVLSIMSYFGPRGTAPQVSADVAQADWTGSDNLVHSPQTPMVNDVMAIQRAYGASTTTRAGDTVYGFNSNLSGGAAALFDFAVNRYPILTLFDSSGIDTLDLSGWTTVAEIRLEEGAYSSANEMTNNIAIAYGAEIENAVGGAGHDSVSGNVLSNRLEGRAGNDVINGQDGDDVLVGGSGNDSIDGGAGTDMAVLEGSFGSFNISFNADTGLYTLDSSTTGTDTYARVEYFQFTDGTRAAAQLLSGDVTAPTLLSTNPADNAAGVAASANLVFSFNEPVLAGVGSFVIFNSNGSVARTISATDTAQITFSGSTVTLNPLTDLSTSSSYYVNIAAGAVKDTSGNAFAGLSGIGTFNFSTAAPVIGDTTPPTLGSSSPADNAVGVALASNLVLSFSEPVQAGGGNIQILNANGSVARSIAVTDAAQVAISGNVVTIDPSTDLAAGAAYYVNIAAGVIKDLAGNAYAGISSSTALNFSTVSAAPTDDYPWHIGTSGVVAVNGAATTGVIEVIADADLFKVSLLAGTSYVFELVRNGTAGGLSDPYLLLYGPDVSLRASDDNSGGSQNARISFTALSGGIYYLGAVDATSGIGAYSLTARTADTTAPTLVSSSPADNATGVASNANLVLTFGEAVTAGTGNIRIYASNGTLARSFSVTDTSQVSFSGTTVTINPSSDLLLGTSYYVNLASGVIQDLAGNAFAGISSASTLNFSTAAPLVVDDFPMSFSTTGLVTVDTVGATGVIDFADDGDLFKVSLVQGQSYVFRVVSSGLPDPYMVLYDTEGLVITSGDNSEGSLDAEIIYTANVSGVHYLAAFDFGSGLGSYRVSAWRSQDDFPWNTNTAGVVTVGGIATTGVIEAAGDADLFKVSLTAGVTYTFDLVRAVGGLEDPYLMLFDPAINEVAYDDDGGTDLNSSISYTAATTGTYFLGAMDFDTGTGGYSLSARAGSGGSQTFVVGSTAASVDEGSTVGFTVVTTGVANGTSLSYALSGSGATVGDVSTALSGGVTVSNGLATLNVSAIADLSTEGTEALTATFFNGGTAVGNATVTVNDTSRTPTAALTFFVRAAAASMNEGSSVGFTVTTANVADGTVLTYALTGAAATSADLATALTGSVTVNNGLAALSVAAKADLLTEGTESFTAFFFNAGAGVGNATVAINDTSLTPANSPTFVVSSSSGSINEGSAVNFTVATTNVPDGTVLGYGLSGSAGFGSADVQGALSGSLTVNNSLAALTVVTAADQQTEGVESMTLVLTTQAGAAAGLPVTVTINDTSTGTAPVSPSFTVAGTQGHDCFAPSGGNRHLGGAGNDTYVISPFALSSAVTASITDTEGSNRVQLVDGTIVSASSFFADAVQLTLSSGAKVQVLGASKFGFQIGANAPAGDTSTTLTYAQFASTLGAVLPSGSTPAAGTVDFLVPSGFAQAAAPTPLTAGVPFTVAGTQVNDVLVPAAGNSHLGGGGDDTYIISPNVLSGSVTASITDTEGGNLVQIVDATVVAASSFFADAVQLTLGNGAKVQILGASKYSYQLGANLLSDDRATTLNYAQFGAQLGVTVPPPGAPAVSGTPNFVVPGSAPTGSGFTTVNLGLTDVVATALAEAFLYDFALVGGRATKAGDGALTISGFDPAHDKLVFVNTSSQTVYTEAQFKALPGVAISENPFTGSTSISFDPVNGAAGSVTLTGIVDGLLEQVVLETSV